MALEAMAGLSAALAEAAAGAGASVVRVEGRRRPSSGVALSADTIVTAAHALEEEQISVGLPDGRVLPATVVGRDAGSDVALLKVEGAALTPASWADDAASTSLAIGQLVLSVSRPGRTARAALGVVNAVSEGEWRAPGGGRLERYVELDVGLKPGFSGSAIVDSAGRVVALGTAGLSRGSASAIPAAAVRRIAQAITAHGGVQRGYLGVSTIPARLPEAIAQQLGQPGAILVAGVDPESPAGKAGVLLGDAIALLDGRALAHPGQLLELLDERSVGRLAQLKIVRAGELRDVSVVVGQREARP